MMKKRLKKVLALGMAAAMLAGAPLPAMAAEAAPADAAVTAETQAADAAVTAESITFTVENTRSEERRVGKECRL